MNLPRCFAAGTALLLLAACGSAEERPFNEQFNSTFSGLESKAAALESEAENSVTAREEELDAEARALANRVGAEANSAAPDHGAIAPPQ